MPLLEYEPFKTLEELDARISASLEFEWQVLKCFIGMNGL